MFNHQSSHSIPRFYPSPLKTSLILFLVALVIRLAVIFYWQFDGLYGQDAYAYFDQAIAITRNLPQGRPPPANFFWPNGYPLLIAFFTLFAGQTAWAGQLAALLCGAALAPLAFWLSLDLFNTDNTISIRSFCSGILSGLIVAVAGQPILSSVVIMADMPALFWATLAAWLVVRAVRSEQGSSGAGEQGRIFTSAPLLSCSTALLFLAAGAALALAIISRWLYVLMVPALSLYVIFNYWKANPVPGGPFLSKANFGLQIAPSNKTLYWQMFLAVFSGAIILIPQLWLSLNEPAGLAHSFLLGWSPIHFWQRQFENTEGYFSYLLPMAIFYAQPTGHPAYIFPLLGLASFWATWRLGQARQWAPLILLLGWAAPVYLFLAGISFQNFRFGLTLYLPLVILTGYGLGDFLSRGTGRQGRSPYGRLRTGAGAQGRIFSSAPLLLRSPAASKTGIILSLLGMLAWAYPMLDSFLTTQNQSKIIARQVEQMLPPQATLITFGLTLTFQHYTRLNTIELFYLDENSLKTLTESSESLYLLLDLKSIETQWQGKAPQINYQWLKKNRTLSEIRAFPPYVLFRVSAAKDRG